MHLVLAIITAVLVLQGLHSLSLSTFEVHACEIRRVASLKANTVRLSVVTSPLGPPTTVRRRLLPWRQRVSSGVPFQGRHVFSSTSACLSDGIVIQHTIARMNNALYSIQTKDLWRWKEAVDGRLLTKCSAGAGSSWSITSYIHTQDI